MASSICRAIDSWPRFRSAEIPVGQTPKGIVAGGGGIWVASSGDATLSRIDPTRRVVLRTITLPGTPSDAAFVGRLWVLHNRGASFVDPYAGSAAVSEVNSHFDNVARTIDVPAGFGNTYDDPMAASTRAVWVAGPTGVSKIDADSGDVHPRLPLSGVADLVSDGRSVWAVTIDGTISRIDPTGEFVAETVSLSSTVKTGAVAAGLGSLWVIGAPPRPPPQFGAPFVEPGPQVPREHRMAALFRVDPRNGEVRAKLALDGSPVAVAVGRGAVWIADAERGEVVRVDPTTNRVVARIPLGARPTAIAVDDNAVWVTVT